MRLHEYVAAFVVMILAYLVLTEAKGAVVIISATGKSLSELAKTFQGRG